MLESGKDDDPKGNLVSLGEYGVIRALFIDLDLIYNESFDPAKVDTADLNFAFEGLFDAFNGDLFDQSGEYDTVNIRSERCQEKQYGAEDDKDFFVLHRFIHYTPVIFDFNRTRIMLLRDCRFVILMDKIRGTHITFPAKNNSVCLNILVLTTLILCGAALYFSPLHSASFNFDDHASIGRDKIIRDLDIPGIFNAFNTRFLVGLSFALNYRWCALDAAGYRLINLLIHCLNAFLVYLLIRSTLYLCQARKPIFFCPLEWPAFFASLLFLCHPIQTEPVNFITQRFVLMGTFFYLLTLVFYIRYRCEFKKRYMIASWGAAIAAMFCKEFVVTLPLMIALYDLYFLEPFNETAGKRGVRLVPFFIIVLIVPLLLLRTPVQVVGVANIAYSEPVQGNSTQKVRHHIDITRARRGIGRRQYFLTELNVMCTYVRLMFLPVHQDLDYDYPLTDHMDRQTLLSASFLLCLLAVAWATYRSCRIISFCILWFFIALSVESSFIPIGHVIAEYRLYLASVGFAFLVMTLIYARQADKKKLDMMAVIIIFSFSVLTYQRNKVWISELTLWNDAVQKSPLKARPYNNRGSIYDKQGDLTRAMSDYNKAIELNPDYANAYFNRGLIFAREGDFSRAMSDYNKAIQIQSDYAKAYYNRGLIYIKERKFTQALADFKTVIAINPDDAEPYNERAFVYEQLKKYGKAGGAAP